MDYFTIGEPLVMFSVARSLDHWGDPVPSLESGWRVNRHRVEDILMLARDGDIIIGAYRAAQGSWQRGTLAEGTWGRWLWRVEEARDVWDDYVGKRVPPGLVGPSNRPVIKYAEPE